MKQENDEYQYPKDEYVAEPEKQKLPEEEVVELESSPSPIKRFIMNNKRMVAGGVIAILLLIVFQVMNHGDGERISVSPSAIKIQARTVVATPTTSPPVRTENDAVLLESVARVNDAILEDKKEIDQLKIDVQTLHDQLNQATATSDELKQVITLLLEEMKQFQQSESEKVKPVSAKSNTKTAPPVTYKIRALVAGRAWLVSSDGLLESVTVGDPIPGLGQVESIDEAHGSIVTSSGETIRLGN